ncbi:MAG: acetoacetate--CoA ligase [Vicinamibacterales bacterium]
MQPLWTPSEGRIAAANLTRFRRFVGERLGVQVDGYRALHRWSITNRPAFWSALWDFTGVIAAAKGDRILVDDGMPGATFFPDARLNFAENLLRRRDDGDALVFRGEDGASLRVTWRALHAHVAREAAALRTRGVGPGDRVAAVLPNCPEAIVAVLACASIGAVWSSCSPDFGVKGVLDRFQQIAPRVLYACDGYFYAGKAIDVVDKIRDIATGLPEVEQIVLVPFMRAPADCGTIDLDVGPVRLLSTRVSRAGGSSHSGTRTGDVARRGAGPHDDSHAPPGEDDAGVTPALTFEPLPFAHPLYILFSSGTTGLPKCIVHGAGGTLLQHLKEHQLQMDVRRDDRVFWFTTLGWMMWNWLVTALASDATLLLYDGSPFHPDGTALFDFAAHERMTHMGLSAKYIQAAEKAGVVPSRSHDLSALRVIGSTGSTLLPEGFDYVYRDVKADVCLSSISGGTDIVSCFVGGAPTEPVRRGQIQAAGLGMAVEVWDDRGERVIGEKGELVCTRAFPSMPVGFWNDADQSRYRAAYFEKYPGVWAHGDFAEETPEGSFLIYGRSDATLNPQGVRIGTAEIYRQVEQLEEVLECVAVGQDWDGDTRIVLFVVLREGRQLDAPLVDRIKRQIRSGASPRHVPARVIQVAEIPRTRSGKITELAIRDVVHGRPVKNLEAIANPAALDHFSDRPELKH